MYVRGQLIQPLCGDTTARGAIHDVPYNVDLDIITIININTSSCITVD